MRSTTETRIKNPDTPANEALSFRWDTLSNHMLLGYIPEEQINESVIKLSCNKKAYAFNATLIDEVAMHKYPAWSLYNTKSLPTLIEVWFSLHLWEVDFIEQSDDSFGSPEDFQQATGVIRFKSQWCPISQTVS